MRGKKGPKALSFPSFHPNLSLMLNHRGCAAMICCIARKIPLRGLFRAGKTGCHGLISLPFIAKKFVHAFFSIIYNNIFLVLFHLTWVKILIKIYFKG